MKNCAFDEAKNLPAALVEARPDHARGMLKALGLEVVEQSVNGWSPRASFA